MWVFLMCLFRPLDFVRLVVGVQLRESEITQQFPLHSYDLGIGNGGG